jgi:acyl carrier protein
MVPATFLVVESLPLSPNGKIDRCALPEPELGYSMLEKPYLAPRTRTEEELTRIWQEVLAITHLGIDDNFFELGGHSLTATRLLSRLRDFFQIDLPLRVIFDHPTIASLSQSVDQAKGNPVEGRMHPVRPLNRQTYAAAFDSAGKLNDWEMPRRKP